MSGLYKKRRGTENFPVHVSMVEASPADLIAAVSKLEGADTVEIWHPGGWSGEAAVVKPGLPDGRYLVVPLEADKKDTDVAEEGQE